MSLSYVYDIQIAKIGRVEMAAISSPIKNFEIPENFVEVQSLFFDLSPHFPLYVPTELRNAGEFEACPRYDDNDVRRTFCRLNEIFL